MNLTRVGARCAIGLVVALVAGIALVAASVVEGLTFIGFVGFFVWVAAMGVHSSAARPAAPRRSRPPPEPQAARLRISGAQFEPRGGVHAIHSHEAPWLPGLHRRCRFDRRTVDLSVLRQYGSDGRADRARDRAGPVQPDHRLRAW